MIRTVVLSVFVYFALTPTAHAVVGGIPDWCFPDHPQYEQLYDPSACDTSGGEVVAVREPEPRMLLLLALGCLIASSYWRRKMCN